MTNKYSTIEKIVTLTPLDQRFISSCYCPTDHPNMTLVEQWKEKLQNSANKDKPYHVDPNNMVAAFPNISKFLIESSETNFSTVEYFTSMNSDSHNALLYSKMYEIIKKNNVPVSFVSNVLKKANGCSVKVAKSDGSELWSINGIIKAELDYETFNISKESYYVLTHGMLGESYTVIDIADEKTYNSFKKLPDMWKSLLESMPLDLQ